jgi:hypothetical protein
MHRQYRGIKHFLRKLRFLARSEQKPCWKILAAYSRARVVPIHYSDANFFPRGLLEGPPRWDNQCNDISAINEHDFFTKGPWVQAGAVSGHDTHRDQNVTSLRVSDPPLLRNVAYRINAQLRPWWRPWRLFMVWLLLSHPTFFACILAARYVAAHLPITGGGHP